MHTIPLVTACSHTCIIVLPPLPLHTVVASEKGVVVGRLQFTEDGDAINCSAMGVGGKAIPPNVDKVDHVAGITQQ